MSLTDVEWQEQYGRVIEAAIRRRGCFLQFVLGSGGEPPSPSFCYTTGLYAVGHPELLVFGLDQQSSAGLLNDVSEMVWSGRSLLPGEVLTFPGDQTSYLVERLPNPAETLLAANRYFAGPLLKSVPAYQLTWSVNGAFPWEAGYPYRAWMQPRPGAFSATAGHLADGRRS